MVTDGPTDGRTDGWTENDLKLHKKAIKAKKQESKKAKDGRTDIVAYRVACTRLKTE